MATYPTPAQVDAAVPVDGEPSRALTNAVLKSLAEPPTFDQVVEKPETYPPTIGTSATTAKAGNYQPTAANISDATSVGRAVLTADDAAAARSAIGAGTSSLAIGAGATQAAAGNHTHGDASAASSGFMTAAQFIKLGNLPPFKQVLEKPSAMDSPGQQFEFFIDDEGFYLCISENNWRMWPLTGWE